MSEADESHPEPVDREGRFVAFWIYWWLMFAWLVFAGSRWETDQAETLTRDLVAAPFVFGLMAALAPTFLSGMMSVILGSLLAINPRVRDLLQDYELNDSANQIWMMAQLWMIVGFIAAFRHRKISNDVANEALRAGRDARRQGRWPRPVTDSPLFRRSVVVTAISIAGACAGGLLTDVLLPALRRDLPDRPETLTSMYIFAGSGWLLVWLALQNPRTPDEVLAGRRVGGLAAIRRLALSSATFMVANIVAAYTVEGYLFNVLWRVPGTPPGVYIFIFTCVSGMWAATADPAIGFLSQLGQWFQSAYRSLARIFAVGDGSAAVHLRPLCPPARPLHRLGAVIVALLSVITAAELASFVLAVSVRDDATAFLNGTISQQDFETRYAPALLVATMGTLTTATAAVVTMMWMRRAAINNQTAGRPSRWPARIAITGWFLPPFVIYIVPYLVMKEIATGTAQLWSDRTQSSRARTGWLFCWWLCYGLAPLILLWLSRSNPSWSGNTLDLARRVQGHSGIRLFKLATTTGAATSFAITVLHVSELQRRAVQ